MILQGWKRLVSSTLSPQLFADVVSDITTPQDTMAYIIEYIQRTCSKINLWRWPPPQQVGCRYDEAIPCPMTVASSKVAL